MSCSENKFINFSLSYCSAALLVAAAAVPSSARAEESDFDVVLGLGGGVVPRYEGSDRVRVWPLPVIDVTWRDRLFLSTRNGLGFYAINRESFQLGAGVGYQIGREESDDRRNLDGLGDIDDAAQGKVFARYRWGSGIALSAEVSRIFGGSDGTQADLKLEYPFAVTERLTVTPNLYASWADDDYMEAYFGVSSEQAENSGLPVYAAEAGFKNVGGGFDIRYMPGRHWMFGLHLGAGYLLDDVADSPVVQEKVQPFGFVSIAYRF